MRKLLMVIMIFILGFSLTACKTDTSAKSTGSTAAKSIEGENTTKENSKLAKLYAAVLDSFIPIDNGLNGDMKYIAIDTNTLVDATKEDKEYILNYFKKYNVEVMDESFETLKEKGMVKECNYLEGLLLQIDVDKIKISNNKAVIEGSKFRSGIGAIGVRCEAVYKNGNWVIEKADMTWIS